MDERMKRLAQMLAIARSEANVSQEALALELNVSTKTVRNWETGNTSPSVFEVFEWFRVLGVNPVPYLYQFVYPEMYAISGADSDEKIRAALSDVIDSLPMDSIRQLLYILYGDHGSSPKSVLDLVTAHLQTPLRDRTQHANVVIHSYDMAVKMDTIHRPDHIQPDINSLKRALELGIEAVVDDNPGYSM